MCGAAAELLLSARLPELRFLVRRIAALLMLLSLMLWSTHAAYALPAGLISDWTGNGTAADATGTNNGAYTGSYVQGIGGQQAFDITGPGSPVVSAPTTNLPVGTAARTVSVWVDTLAYTGNGPGAEYFEYGSQSVNGGAFSIGETTGGVFQFETTNYGFTAGAFSLNRWYYLALTQYSNGTEDFYVNGALAATASIPSNTAAGSSMTIGGITQSASGGLLSAYYVDAYVENLHVYNVALTSSQISQDMMATVPEPSLPLMLGLFGVFFAPMLVRRVSCAWSVD